MLRARLDQPADGGAHLHHVREPCQSERIALGLLRRGEIGGGSRENKLGDALSVIFNILLHVLLLGSMVLFGIVLVMTALRADNASERVKRVLALFLGAVVVIGAQVSGVGFAEFTAGSLASARVASAGAAIVTTVVPALVGAGLGFLIVWTYGKSEALAMRILCFVGMLALVAFIEVYALATQANGVFLGVAALPNIAFVAGVGLVFVFSPDKESRASLLSLFRRTSRTSNGASAETATSARDPFDI